MTSSRSVAALRTLLATGVATGLAAGLALVGPTGSATAAPVQGSVLLDDCDILLDGNRVSSAPDWDVDLTVDHPSPVAVNAPVTVEVDVPDLAGGVFPEDLYEVGLAFYLYFADENGYTRQLDARRTFDTFDASAPLTMGEFEEDEDWGYLDSGRYAWSVTGVEIVLFGYRTSDDELVTYTYECDADSTPTALFDVGVYDPDAPAVIVLDAFTATQGDTFVVTGEDFPREATDDPDTDVDVYVGDDLAASFDVDEIGSFTGVVQVPQFAKTGKAVPIRAVAVGESAEAALAVKAKKAKLSAKNAKSGKKTTITGDGFKPGDKVKLTLKRKGRAKGTTSYKTTATADGDGAIKKAVKLKKAATGNWKATAKGPKSHRTGKTSFKVS